MDFLSACIHLDPMRVIETGSYLGITFLIFAESGLLFGIFFPGDSVLFTAGLVAAGGYLSLPTLVLFVTLAAIVGDSVGYWFGANVGVNFFNRKDSWLFKRSYVTRTQEFYATYGGRAVVLARFVPIVRTLAPILAGIGSMPYARFFFFNILGAGVWAAGLTLLGFTLGVVIPGIEHYILPLSLGIIFVSFLPILVNLARGRRALAKSQGR